MESCFWSGNNILEFPYFTKQLYTLNIYAQIKKKLKIYYINNLYDYVLQLLKIIRKITSHIWFTHYNNSIKINVNLYTGLLITTKKQY